MPLKSSYIFHFLVRTLLCCYCTMYTHIPVSLLCFLSVKLFKQELTKMNYTPILIKISENYKLLSYIFKLNYLLQS